VVNGGDGGNVARWGHRPQQPVEDRAGAGQFSRCGGFMTFRDTVGGATNAPTPATWKTNWSAWSTT